MAFPDDPLPIEIGMFLDGVWVNGPAFTRDPVTVSTGRANWSARTETGRATFTLDNRAGLWSPDYPSGPHHGHYRRNVAARVGVGRGDRYLAATEAGGEAASTPSTAALNIAGDLDIRFEYQLHEDVLDPAGGTGRRYRVASKGAAASGWQIGIYQWPTGEDVIAVHWWDVVSNSLFATSRDSGTRMPLRFLHDRMAVRVTIDASAGSVSWYTADRIAGPWTQLGAPHIVGATSIGATTEPLRLAGSTADSADYKPLPGKLFAFELRDGIDGAVVAAPDFKGLAVATTGFTDTAGAPWTVAAGGRVTDMRWRFHGELASLPVRSDLQGRVVWAPVEATGLFRRFRQGTRLINSALRRAITMSAASLVQYWPMEETGDTVTRFAPAVGTSPFDVTNGLPAAGANTDFVSSAPISEPDESIWSATVDAYTDTGDWQVRWLQSIPDGFVGSNIDSMRVETSDMDWHLRYRDNAGGQFSVVAFRDGPQVYQSAWISFNATATPFRVSLTVKQNGGNVDFALEAQEEDSPAGGGFADTAVVAGSSGVVTRLVINRDSNIDEWGIGHVTLQNADTPTTELAAALSSHTGETAGRRIMRICAEEGIRHRVEGDPDDTEIMGAQRPMTLIGLLEECADTDLGILHEPRDTLGVGYRTRTSMVNQATSLALDYGAGEVAGPLELDRDDQDFSNDVTVTNAGGATARAVLDDGSAMSIAEPPVGAGSYDSSFDVNTLDARLPALAGTRLGLSAVNEPRVSRLRLGLEYPQLVADQALTDTILGLSLGDRITIANYLPLAVGPLPIDQLTQGVRETIESFVHRLDLLTSPAAPWSIAEILFRINQPWPIDTYVTPGVQTGPNGVQYDIRPGVQSRPDWDAALAGIAADTNRGNHVIRFLDGQHSNEYRIRGNLIAGGGNYNGANGAHNTITGSGGVTITGVQQGAQAFPAIDLAAVKYWDIIGDFVIDGGDFNGIRYQYSGGDADSRTKIWGPTIRNTEHNCIQIQGWFQAPFTPSLYWDVDGVTLEGGTRVRTVPEFNEGLYFGTGHTEWVDFTGFGTVRRADISGTQADSVDFKTGAHDITVEDCVIHDSALVAGTGSTSIPVGHCTMVFANIAEPGPDTMPDNVFRRNRLYRLSQASGPTRAPIIVGRGGQEAYSNLIWDCDSVSAVRIDGGAGGMGVGIIAVDGNTSDGPVVDNVDGYGPVTAANNVPDEFPASFLGPITGIADQGQGAGSGFAITSHIGQGVGAGRNDATDTPPNSPLDPGALAAVSVPAGAYQLMYSTDFSAGPSVLADFNLYDGPIGVINGNNGWGGRRAAQVAVSTIHPTEGAVMNIVAQMGTGGDTGLLLHSGAKLWGTNQDYSFRYGRIRFRMRMDLDPDQATSGLALLWQADTPTLKGPELNMFENFANRDTRNPIQMFLHWGQNGEFQKQDDYGPAFSGNQWHDYEVIWLSNLLTLAIDGGTPIVLSTSTTQIPQEDMDIVFQNDAWDSPLAPGVQPDIGAAQRVLQVSSFSVERLVT